MKLFLAFFCMLGVSAWGAGGDDLRTIPNREKLRALRDTRERISAPSKAFEAMPMAMEMDAGEEGHVLVLLVEFGGTDSFTWTPGVSTWDPFGYVDGDEWDGVNYNNPAASQFFADVYGISSSTNFSYTGPLHNEIPRPPSGATTNCRWNAIWYPDFSPSYYEKIAFGNGVVFDFNRDDGSHYYADHTGISVKNYYSEMSSGAFDLSGDVYGWISVPHSLMYYAADDLPGKLTISDSLYAELSAFGAIEGAGDAKSLVVDACRAAAARYPNINWSDYDLDGDGVIDSLWIVTAGFGEEDGRRYDNSLSPENRMWAHSSQVYPPQEIADGISVADYIMNPENSGVYVMGHEYGHALGAIDLYAYQEGTLSPGNWAIMCGSSSGLPEGFKPVAMDPYHLDGWGWLNPAVVDQPFRATQVELYQAGTGRDIPSGMHRAARIDLEKQQVDLPVDPPPGKSTCWWGGNRSLDDRWLSSYYSYFITGLDASLSLTVAYDMEESCDYLVVAVRAYDETGVATSPWDFLSNAHTVDQYGGASSIPYLTGTSANYPSYGTESFSLKKYVGKYVAFSVGYITDRSVQLGGPFVGEMSLDMAGTNYNWSADEPGKLISDWSTVAGEYFASHYYYLQWRNTGADGGYDDVLGHSSNRFGQATSGLLTWYVNELYTDNESPDYLGDFPSYGAKGVALVVDAHPGTFFRSDTVWGCPCTNTLAAYHNLYLNADAAFSSSPTAVFPDGVSGNLAGRPFFTDSRNYCAGAELTYVDPVTVPPTYEWVARKFDGSVVTPSKVAYGCRALGMPNDAEIHRVWIDSDGYFHNEFETADCAGSTGNPVDVSGQYGWNAQVYEDRGKSAVVRIWNSRYNAPYPVVMDCFGKGHTVPADDFLAYPSGASEVSFVADEHYHIHRLIYNGTEIPSASGQREYSWSGRVSKNSSLRVEFAPDLVAGSSIPKAWFAEQNIPLDGAVLTSDYDGDGLSNQDEYAAGTRANDASSCLQLAAINVSNTMDLTWNSQWGKWYAIDVSTNLMADSFQKIMGPVPGEHATTSRPVDVPESSSVFYRIRMTKPAP